MSARDVIRAQKRKLGIAGTGAAAAIALSSTLILHWEGEDLVAKHYRHDPPGIITVCNGVTNYDIRTLTIGMRFTHEQCEDLRRLLVPKYRAPLVACVHGFAAMPLARQAALTSAAYNLGPGTVCRSTAVRRLNAGDVKGGCEALAAFIKANGVVLKGLINRRRDPDWGEIAWCLSGE